MVSVSLSKYFIIFVSILLGACNHFGPDGLRGTHPLYNSAIVDIQNEQFIQNIVRLRYRDPVFFLDVSSVTTSLTLNVAGGLDQSSLELTTGLGLLQGSLNAAYTSSPTIVYAPLQGEEFTKSMLLPVPSKSLLALTESGWSIRRVFGLCVERVNNISNAPSASGPTPENAPKNIADFKRLVQLLTIAKDNYLITTVNDPKTGELLLEIKSSPEHQADILEIKTLLELDPSLSRYHISSEFSNRKSDTIAIRTRTLISIFFYLSHHTDVPIDHTKNKLVTISKDRLGHEFDWGQTAGGSLFHIRQSETKPEQAFVSIPYRDHWFYLQDNDLESKSTFMLLSQLFRLQAGDAQAPSPSLTIPIR